MEGIELLADHPARAAALASMRRGRGRGPRRLARVVRRRRHRRRPGRGVAARPDGRGAPRAEAIAAFYDTVIAQAQVRFELRESYAAGDECANVGTITSTFPDGTAGVVDGVYVYRVDGQGDLVSVRASGSTTTCGSCRRRAEAGRSAAVRSGSTHGTRSGAGGRRRRRLSGFDRGGGAAAVYKWPVHGFHLAYEGFDPDEEGLREALTTTGNGVLCSRGAAEWEEADGVHYPGTYLHGAYNRETTVRGGLPILNEDLVNLPNWLVLELRIDDDDAIRLADVEVLDYEHVLHTRDAVLERRLRFRDRLVGRPRCGADASSAWPTCISPASSGSSPPRTGRARSVVAALDGRVTNSGVPRYGQLEGGTSPPSLRPYGPEVVALTAVTRQSRLYVSNGGPHPGVLRRRPARRGTHRLRGRRLRAAGPDLRRRPRANRDRREDGACSTARPRHADTQDRAATLVQRAPDFTAALERHDVAWEEPGVPATWSSPTSRGAAAPPPAHLPRPPGVLAAHRRPGRGGAARGLSGEAYRGHVFWDELFVYPFLTLRSPRSPVACSCTASAVSTRPGGGARRGLPGSDVPVAERQRGDRGDPARAPQPAVRSLGPGPQPPPATRQRRDLLQRLAVLPGDHDHGFLRDRGAEMMLEIARFWASIATFDPARAATSSTG